MFVPIGYFIDVYQFNGIELLTNFCALSSTYNGTWWFIYQYIMMLLFSPALLIVLDEATKDERSIIKILFFALTVIVGWIIVLRIGIYIETVYFILFILGMIFERNKLFDSAERKILEIPKKFKGGKTPIVGILFVLFMRLLIAKYTQFWYQMDIFLVPMFVFLLKPIILLNRKISSLLSFLGKHSTSIWLTHGFICDYFSVRYLYSLKYSVLIMIAFLLVAIILGVIVDEIFHWFCRVVNS